MRFSPFLLLVLLLSACGSSRNDDGGGIRVAMLKGPSAMGMVQMIDSLRNVPGTDGTGADIAVDVFTEPMQVRKAMLEGSADFAALPMNMAAVLYNRGMEYVLAAVPVAGSLYLAGSGSDINSWEDLRGRKVFLMAKGMTPDILFRYLLIRNGLRPDEDVVLDYNFPSHNDIASAMAAGRAPLGVITEPYLSTVMSVKKEIRPLLDLNAEWVKINGFPIAETAFLVKKSLLEDNPETVEKVINGYARSTNWVIGHPDSAAVLMVRYGIMQDADAAARAIPKTHLVFWRAGEKNKEIDAYLRTLFEMSPEIIGGKLPDEGFYK